MSRTRGLPRVPLIVPCNRARVAWARPCPSSCTRARCILGIRPGTFAETIQKGAEIVTCCNDGDHEHDDERRRRRLASQRKYRLGHKKERADYARCRRATDPVHREHVRAYQNDFQRKKRFKEVYGITIEDYNAMFVRQGGACAVCRRTGLKLVVDHCHLTGQVRALLCLTCNSALGFWRDSSDIVRAAAQYLQKYRTGPPHAFLRPLSFWPPGNCRRDDDAL